MTTPIKTFHEQVRTGIDLERVREMRKLPKDQYYTCVAMGATAVSSMLWDWFSSWSTRHNPEQ